MPGHRQYRDRGQHVNAGKLRRSGDQRHEILVAECRRCEAGPPLRNQLGQAVFAPRAPTPIVGLYTDRQF